MEEKPILSRINDLLPLMESTMGLIWRYDPGEKKVAFLNEYEIPLLGEDAGKLLTDLVWAGRVVVEEDFFRFKLFIKNMRQGEKGSVIFRVRDKRDNCYWLRATGTSGGQDNSHYHGNIQDISDQVTFINQLLEKELERQTMIEHEGRPVILVDMQSKGIISRNTDAYELFGYSYHEFNDLTFQDLYPKDQASRVARIYETCLLDGSWAGKLSFVKKGKKIVNARVRFKRLSIKDRNLLRISVDDTYNTALSVAGGPAEPGKFKDILVEAVAEKQDINDILDTFLVHPFRDVQFDAILYADVKEKKGKVYVYARGAAFASMKPGSIFDFEGTVSQAIRENRLDFLLMGDTLESTRPTDWALFIPYGIRSYFARAFYHGQKLSSVLFLCSTQPHQFSEDQQKDYELFYPAFLKGLANWRKGKKGAQNKS